MDGRDTFLEALDRLLSRHVDELGHLPIAELLHATANGLVVLSQPGPNWDEESKRVEIPYLTSEALEAALEDLLSRRVVCVDVEGVPMMADVTLRVVASNEHVDLVARSVQQTAAGVVFQIQPGDVEAQRKLVGLAGVLRSSPYVAPVVNRNSQRKPNLNYVEEPPPEPQPVVAPVAPAESAEPLRPPEPDPFDGDGEESSRDAVEELFLAPDDEIETNPAPPSAASSRLVTQPIDVLEAAESRMMSPNAFEVLAVHFAADTEEVREARREALTRYGVDNGYGAELQPRVSEVRNRLLAAADLLLVTEDRRRHRAEVVDDLKLGTALDMFARHAETAKMRRDLEAAVQSLRRVVELDPGDEQAREEFEALKQLL